MRLQGKRALITAAGQGIGRSTAEAFIREGAEVIATDIDATLLDDLEGCDKHKLDVTDADAIADLAEAVGSMDILFNCAGYVHAGAILACGQEDWRRSYEVNVTGMYNVIRALLPGMIRGGGGSIINMSSVASSIKGVENRFAYSVTKAAVIGMTKSVAADYIGMGVRCNAICPGTVDTPSLRQRLADTGNYDEARKAFSARQPMGRLGKADEIAALAVYLGCDESSFTTGACHVIDGGWTN